MLRASSSSSSYGMSQTDRLAPFFLFLTITFCIFQFIISYIILAVVVFTKALVLLGNCDRAQLTGCLEKEGGNEQSTSLSLVAV